MTRPDVFAQLTPEQVAGYLARQGWVEVEPDVEPDVPDRRIRYWRCARHPVPHEVQFPVSTHWRDYVSELRWDLSTIAYCEARPSPAEQVARSIAEEA